MSIEQIERRTGRYVSHGFFLRAGAKRTLADGERRAPLVSQNVQADAAVGVDIGVIDAGREVDLRGLEGVVGGEVDCEEEDATRVW